MDLSSIDRIRQRISNIESRFAPKPADSFANYMIRAARSEPTKSTNNTSAQIEQLVRAAAVRHGVKPELALAVARIESGLSPEAVSPVGAVGVMQLMPQTARELGVRDINDVRENVDGGVRYLKQLLLTFKNEKLAVAAYNAGPEAVNKYRGIPPYAETQSYVEKVFREMQSGK